VGDHPESGGYLPQGPSLIEPVQFGLAAPKSGEEEHVCWPRLLLPEHREQREQAITSANYDMKLIAREADAPCCRAYSDSSLAEYIRSFEPRRHLITISSSQIAPAALRNITNCRWRYLGPMGKASRRKRARKLVEMSINAELRAALDDQLKLLKEKFGRESGRTVPCSLIPIPILLNQ
jgi:hypothetical protein